MKPNLGECLVCGAPIVYYQEVRELECEFCHKKFLNKSGCEAGHYICDECHSKEGINAILDYCSSTQSKNPIEIAQVLMDNSYIYMHGPEHHVLVGAVLMAAYNNCGGEVRLEVALKELARRGQEIVGGACGFWGCCGAAVSCGIFTSIVTMTSPLSQETWGLSNLMTATVLKKIAEIGGPRCCKRNTFLAIIEASKFIEKNLGVKLELPEKVICHYAKNNMQCIGKRCPFNKANNN